MLLWGWLKELTCSCCCRYCKLLHTSWEEFLIWEQEFYEHEEKKKHYSCNLSLALSHANDLTCCFADYMIVFLWWSDWTIRIMQFRDVFYPPLWYTTCDKTISCCTWGPFLFLTSYVCQAGITTELLLQGLHGGLFSDEQQGLIWRGAVLWEADDFFYLACDDNLLLQRL